MGTKMMCSGWMSSVANNVPGSVVLKVIGKRADNTEKEIYAFCPGQIGKSYRRAGAAGITTPSGDMVWQVVKVYTMPDNQKGVKIMRIA